MPYFASLGMKTRSHFLLMFKPQSLWESHGVQMGWNSVCLEGFFYSFGISLMSAKLFPTLILVGSCCLHLTQEPALLLPLCWFLFPSIMEFSRSYTHLGFVHSSSGFCQGWQPLNPASVPCPVSSRLPHFLSPLFCVSMENSPRPFTGLHDGPAL